MEALNFPSPKRAADMKIIALEHELPGATPESFQRFA
jgi:hypothetical protein